MISRPAARAWILGAILAAIAVRAPGLDREITHDEAYSWLSYASISYTALLTTYDQPNNHILHSAAMRLSSQLWGGHDEWMLRAPAFFVASIPVTAGLATAALGSPVAGVVAAWWIALHPSHINYSRTARGYSMLALFGGLSCWAVLLALHGRRRMWAAFSVAGFLATWTLPSGALLLLALGGWGSITAWRRQGMLGARAAVIATTAAAAASGLAYVSVFDELVKASERWGVRVWAASDDSLWALFSGGSLLVGGSVFLASLTLLGWVRLLQRRDSFGVLSAVLASVPIAAAIVSGVAGQPRSYFYLLPALIVNAAVWVVDPRPRVRQTGCVLWVVSLVAFGWAQLEPSPTEHGYVALGEAFAKRSSHDVLIAPVYLDVPLDVYTRDAESAKLRVVLQEGRLDALLFACLDSDPRASFERYNLSDDYNMRFEVSLPEAQFDEFFRAGDVRMLGLTDGRRVYPHQETEWEMAQGEAGLRLAEPAFGGLPAIGVRNDGEEFVAVEATRFQAVQEGLMAITFAGRGTANVLATLCEDEGGLWRPQIAYRGQLFPPVMTDARGVTWTLETRIVPVQPNKGYSVCITGKGPGERYVGDLLYTYFPFRPE